MSTDRSGGGPLLLEQIKGPEDLKDLSSEQLVELAGEIRSFLVEAVSRTGGHL
ncbi:1-deoxy-D-xylulose-5-phosphate synthase N-terminal domain-containing protein, partial [Streptomyces capparidis]